MYGLIISQGQDPNHPPRGPEPAQALVHGGRLRAAAARFDIPDHDWLDLSTGINPLGWPVPPVPAAAWARLPEDEDGLEAAARDYFGTAHVLPVAGSQAAIQTLPRVLVALTDRAPLRVGVPSVGYREHAQAWRAAGQRVVELEDGDPERAPMGGLRALDLLVVIHPNNPTGHRWPRERLLDWHARLRARGGWLIVDEAFVETEPARSLAPWAGDEGLIVLRSLGKFFGLAGARVGWVLAEERVRQALAARLGPWSLSGPARWVAERALRDVAWQIEARDWLRQAGHRLGERLRAAGLAPAGGTDLFQWVRTPRAPVLFETLARRGILVRPFDDPPSLRFGLPGPPAAWARLERALDSYSATHDDPVR